jgi:hypothetical protein
VFQPRGCQALNVLGVQSTSYRRPLRSRRDSLCNPPAPHQQRPWHHGPSAIGSIPSVHIIYIRLLLSEVSHSLCFRCFSLSRTSCVSGSADLFTFCVWTAFLCSNDVHCCTETMSSFGNNVVTRTRHTSTQNVGGCEQTIDATTASSVVTFPAKGVGHGIKYHAIVIQNDKHTRELVPVIFRESLTKVANAVLVVRLGRYRRTCFQYHILVYVLLFVKQLA